MSDRPSTSAAADIAQLKQSIADEIAANQEMQWRQADVQRGRRLLAWLDTVTELPADQKAWPCERCPAEPGQACRFPQSREKPPRRKSKAASTEVEPEPMHYGRGWQIGINQPGSRFGQSVLAPEENPAQACAPTAEVGPAGATRGRCLGCDWRGPVRPGDNEAVEDAVTHVWPKWRELPVVARAPEVTTGVGGAKALEAWLKPVRRVMPRWWIDAFLDSQRDAGIDPYVTGPPVRTERPAGCSHIVGRAPGGGYEMSVGNLPRITREQLLQEGRRFSREPTQEAEQSTQLGLF